MKKYSVLIIPFLFFLISSCNQRTPADETVINGVSVPILLSRAGGGDSTNEYKTIVETYTQAIESIKKDKTDNQAYLNLATAFIVEGRATGNSAYYSNAAVKMLNMVLNAEGTNQDQRFQALSLKSTVLLNMHQFKEALDVANEGVLLNGFNAGIYGALVDANVELGNYAAAVAACDKMLGIRPDLRSYSRASYLRQIHGDNRGAIDAMKMAVEAGVPGVEQTEWARVNLGDLYLNIGQADTAAYIYRTSLAYRPEYPYAQMGLAKVERARRNYDSSIACTKAAIKNLGESSFVSYLGELYELKGDHQKAVKTQQDVIDLLLEAETKNARNAVIPHNGNRELAVAYLNAGQYDKALKYAQKDYQMRPANIDANELMAWIAYKKGDMAGARKYAEQTMITNGRNANTLYKDALIFAHAGEAVRADTTRKLAMSISPYIDQRIVNAEKQ